MSARANPEAQYSNPTEEIIPILNCDEPSVEIGLSAAIVAVHSFEPMLLVVKAAKSRGSKFDALPSGPFSPVHHRTFEIGLRSFVAEHSSLELGYAEQLYTFGDRGRNAQPGDQSPHVVSIGYLAISESKDSDDVRTVGQSQWQSWYKYFPWEDWRNGRPEIIDKDLIPRLQDWAGMNQDHDGSPFDAKAHAMAPIAPMSPKSLAKLMTKRQDRLRISFGLDALGWDEERVLERYEILYEAGLVEEAARDGREAAMAWQDLPHLGLPMRYDHRRILATAISRLRAKIKYRPVIFELITRDFTLYDLQRTVECILGPKLHKQNFRRLVESSKLVEPTGDMKTRTGGRPAKLFRFRREIVSERPAPGVRLKPGRY